MKFFSVPDSISSRALFRFSSLVLVYFVTRSIYEFYFFELVSTTPLRISYTHFSYFLTSLRDIFFWGGLIVTSVPWILFLSEMSWSNRSSWIRFFVVLLVTLLSLEWGTVGFNYHYNQFFPFERSVLLLSPLLVYVHPLFVVPFLQILLPFLAQYRVALTPNYLSTSLTIEILYLFLAFLLVQQCFDREDDEIFFVGVLTMFGAINFTAGYSKWADFPGFGWASHFDPALYFRQWHYLGWLCSAPQALIDTLSHVLKITHSLLPLGSALFEGTGFLILIHPLWSILLLFGGIGSLIFTTMASGIFYWEQLIIYGVLSSFLILKKIDLKNLYTPTFFWSSCLLILLAPFSTLTEPYRSNGLPTRHNVKFSIELVTDQGKAHTVNPRIFDPYLRKILPEQKQFFVFTEGPQLEVFQNDPMITDIINKGLKREGNLNGLKRQYGISFDNPVVRNRISSFLKNYILHTRDHNQSPAFGFGSIVNSVPLPHRVFSCPEETSKLPWEITKPIEYVQIRLREAVFRKGQYQPLTDRVIHRIPLKESETDSHLGGFRRGNSN